MNILVTNDDGDSEGLRVLLEVGKKLGKAVAIAPNRQRSAVSGALTLHKPLRLHHVAEDVYSINGTPSDCVLFGIYSGEFEKPDLVLSGINWGENASVGSLLGSGTLGACWQAALERIPSIAFSISRGPGDWRHRDSWGDRKVLVSRVHEIVRSLEKDLGPEKFFNVNMPHHLKDAKIVHVKKTQRERFATSIVRRHDPEGRPYYWISGAPNAVEEGTDVHEVMVKRNIAITEISLSIFHPK
ncbi:MAG TPA: 5'/3'-nucleotidase SurE [Candidatus Bilamarchaeum sp.]|nr:5'/3'-nucleotidase SurE [Candidatus Bilamarchaeum sp.]